MFRRPGGVPNNHSRAGSLPRDPDLVLAARTDAAVLLSGDAEACAALAYRLHLASGWRHGPFTVVDCASPETTETLVLDALFPPVVRTPGVLQLRLVQAGTVLLREVHALPLLVQTRIANRLESVTPAIGRSRRRLMASSSQALIDLVRAGAFDDRLYYRLNTLHIAVGTAASTHPRQ